MNDPGVCFLIHGDSKVGKTWLGASGPAPVLILDAEGGTRFLTQQKRVSWDGLAEPPTQGEWNVCVVMIRDYIQLRSIFQWLNSGRHPFRSVSIDSLSEVQQRCIDSIAGTNQMAQQQWGELLRAMSSLVRNFRDLVTHPTNPLQAVTFIAMSREVAGRKTPYVQGQLAVTLPYYIDVVGYYFLDTSSADGVVRRKLLVSAHPLYEAGDRTGALGLGIENPTITNMLNLIHERNPNT
jgi:hypothetical protein